MKDITINRHKGNEFSNEANASLTNKRAILMLVYGFVKEQADGATTDEVAYELNLLHQTASARMTELKAANLIVANGMKRKTRSGRNAGVWVAA